MKMLTLYSKFRLKLQRKTQIVYFDSPSFFAGPNQNSPDSKLIAYFHNGKPSINYSSPFSTLTNSIVDKKAKMIVFHSPKCGSTSIKYFAMDELNLQTTDYKTHKLFNHIPNMFSACNSQFLSVDEFAAYDKFIVMRNPFDRIVSFFMDKILRNEKIPHKFSNHHDLRKLFLFHAHLTNMKPDEMNISPYDYTFKMFIRLLKVQFDEGKRVFDPHLALQVSSDMAKVLSKQTHFISISQLDELLRYWSRRNKGLSKAVSFQENKSWKTSNSEKISGAANMPIKELIKLKKPIHPESFYDIESHKIIESIYKSDYFFWNRITPLNFNDLIKK